MIIIMELANKELKAKMGILQLLPQKKIIKKHTKNINKMEIILGAIMNIGVEQ